MSTSRYYGLLNRPKAISKSASVDMKLCSLAWATMRMTAALIDAKKTPLFDSSAIIRQVRSLIVLLAQRLPRESTAPNLLPTA